MSKTTTNQNETQTETEDMLQEDQEFHETENIDDAERYRKKYLHLQKLQKKEMIR